MERSTIEVGQGSVFGKLLTVALAAVLVASLVSLGSVTSAAAADGETRTVCATGCDFATIQDAIDGAASGDTIEVSGDYELGARVKIDKSLTLVGSGATVSSDSSLSLDGYAFFIAENVENVVIDGFTFEGAGVVANPFTQNVTIQNNEFLEADYVTRTSIQVYASTDPSRVTSNWVIQNNVINPTANGNNSGIVLATVENAVVSGNTISNTGYDGVQISGSSNVVVTDNTITKTAKSGVAMSNLSGEVSITGNAITETNTADETKRGAIRISGGSTSAQFNIAENVLENSKTAVNVNPDVPGGVTVSVNENQILQNTVGVRNASESISVDATLNWWGTATPNLTTPFVTGQVTTNPYYVNAERTATQVEMPADQPADEPFVVDVPEGSENMNLKLGTATEGVVTVQANVVVNTPSGANVVISAGTKATGPADWTGVISTPTVVENVMVPSTDGENATVDLAIQVGSADGQVDFDQAVKLVLPGQTGKKAGFIGHDDVFHPITDECDANPEGLETGECWANEGGDLVIWTTHFTTFLSYSVTATGGAGDAGDGAGDVGDTTGDTGDAGSDALADTGSVNLAPALGGVGLLALLGLGLIVAGRVRRQGARR